MKSRKLKTNILKKPIHKRVGTYISILVLILVCIFIVDLIRLDVLQAKIMTIVLFGLLGLVILNAFLIIRDGSKWVKVLGYLLTICLVLTSGIGTYGIEVAYGTLKDITNQKSVNTRSVNVYCLKDFTDKTIEDINGQNVGILKTISREHTDACIEALNKDGYTFTTQEYDSSIDLMNDLKGAAIDFIILDESYLTTIEDYDGFEDIADQIKSLYEYQYKVKLIDTKSAVDVTSKPFTILVSGSDSRIGLEETARSDVNLVIEVNPSTHTVLMVSIPRDFYVETACDPSLGCANGQMDKLTHTGLHGIGTTQATIEKLLGIEINYNVTVTFDTVTKLVDALGGITIYSDATIENVGNGNTSCTVYEGENDLNGTCALGFARERYAYVSGDRHRGQNQMTVLTAIINKMVSPSLLTNFNGIMNAVSGTFSTNMSVDEMTSLVNMQLEDGGSWSIYKCSLDGTGGTDYAYELGDYAYVMYPDQTTVDNAKTNLQAVSNGEVPPYATK